MGQAHKGDWFLSSIIKRERLNDLLSDKETYHLVLDLKESGITYEVGDCLKVIPENDPHRVDQILQILGLSGAEIALDKEGNESTIEAFLTTKADLYKLTKKLFTAIVGEAQEERHPLLAADQKELLREHIESSDVLRELEMHRPTLTVDQLTHLLQPLMPRYYSVASSMRVVNEEAHLTVVSVGVASDYLCKGVELHQKKIRIGHHKSPHFGLSPETKNKPIIMIGPGTGIAPFRGFLQERKATGASHENWLFFGERYRDRDFYYKEYLEGLVQEGFLRLDTAFSRDSENKVYVQHRLYENRFDVWEWIDKRGGYLFVCGDKDRMAKSVEEMLLTIFSEVGGMSVAEAKSYLQALRASKRYLRDVY